MAKHTTPAKTDSQRQNKITQRRKESGLKLTKFHLDDSTYERLMQLGEQMGYEEIRKEGNKGRIEQLSQILTHCIINTADAQDDIGIEAKCKKSQELYSLRNICAFRKKSGDNDASIAHFMQEHAYTHPSYLIPESTETNQWTEETIQELLEQPEELEEHFYNLSRIAKRSAFSKRKKDQKFR